MKCPMCGSESKVVDTRDSPDGGIRRRRECLRCRLRWTTYEKLSAKELVRFGKPQTTTETSITIDIISIGSVLEAKVRLADLPTSDR